MVLQYFYRLSELHCCRDQRIGLETKYQKKWHTPILPPPLLNSYFKPKTQRLEICKNFWKGHSINWTSGNFFLRNSFLDFVSPHEEGVQRQVQTLLGSAPGSAPLLRDAQFSAFPSPTHSHVFSRRVCCVFPPNNAPIVIETLPPALSLILFMCRLICGFWWLCCSITCCDLCASSKKSTISYFWFVLLSWSSLYHTLWLNIFVNWGILNILLINKPSVIYLKFAVITNAWPPPVLFVHISQSLKN